MEKTNGSTQNGVDHIREQYPTTKVPRGIPSRLCALNPNTSLAVFQSLCSQETASDFYRHVSYIQNNIPVYQVSGPSGLGLDFDNMERLKDEFHHILLHGPGVFVLRGMYADRRILDGATQCFRDIISRERNSSKGDHFGAADRNDRVWNSFGKHCQENPDSFLDYYQNPWLNVVCDSWLGPAWRLTAQVNVVNPGGAAQVSHRDYHLGFQSTTACARYPKSTQIATQFLTLQGAVAHSDMPLESGPTRFLPFSQMFEEGYQAYRSPEFQKFFDDHWVSLPLGAGDGVFFNPALFHAAGSNTTNNVERIANLLQISSTFGKPMEKLDSITLVKACWDEFVARHRLRMSDYELDTVIKVLGEGYPFPTNLDKRPPAKNGMAPESEQDILREALLRSATKEDVVHKLLMTRHDSEM